MTSDCQPRTKNGQPAHSTTGVAKRELDPVRQSAGRSSGRAPIRCPPISSAKTGSGQREADPEAARHVDQLGVRPASARREHRLERHAADRAGARADLADLRMHRAGVDRAFGHRRGFALRRRRDTSRDRPRTSRGSRPSRSSRAGPRGCAGAWRCAGRPSCRRPDRARRSAAAVAGVSHGVRAACACPQCCMMIGSACAPSDSLSPGLHPIPRRGIYQPCETTSRHPAPKRLNRIEGQVRGLSRMVEDDRYCIDIVTQIAAVRAALRRLEEEILRDHVGALRRARDRVRQQGRSARARSTS